VVFVGVGLRYLASLNNLTRPTWLEKQAVKADIVTEQQ
jgi:hypothetical protein